MTLRHLRIFVTVCKYGSVTEAATHLFLAQPSVSVAINELEKYYGIKLFDRLSRRLYITELGKQFLGYATHIVNLVDEMEQGIKDWDKIGVLRIGASITIGTHLIPDYVKQFKKQYPQMQVQVIIDNSEKIQTHILQNTIDIALIEGNVCNEQIKEEKFLEDELVIIAANNHPLRFQECVNILDLQAYDFILREKGSAGRELFDSLMLLHNIEIKPAWEGVSTQAIIKAVEAGLGLSVLPYLLVEKDVLDGKVCSINVNELNLKRHFSIIYHKNKYLTPAIKSFVSLCKLEKSKS